MHFRFFLFCIVFGTLQSNAVELIKAQSSAPVDKTFSCPINSCIQSLDKRILYMAAAQEGAHEFALAAVNINQNQCTWLAPETIEMSDTQKMAHPFYNGKFSHLSLLSDGLAVVSQKNPAAISIVPLMKNTQLFKENEPLDAHGNKNGVVVHLTSDYAHNLFVAVQAKNQDQFGADGSGIAMLSLYQKEEVKEEPKSIPAKSKKQKEAPNEKEKEKSIIWVFEQKTAGGNLARNAVSSSEIVQQPEIKKAPLKTIPHAFPVDIESPQLKINGTLAQLHLTDMHWDPVLKVLYAAFYAQAGSHEQDGARGILMGYIDAQQEFQCTSIAAESVFSGTSNKIIGTCGADQSVSIHHVRSMFTTTFLNYLIVHGGTGKPDAPKRNVYALPIVNLRETNGALLAPNTAYHGTLAKIATPVNKFAPTGSHVFLGRHFNELPQKPEDIYDVNSPAAQIGGGPLQVDIDEIIVSDDTVFAVVQSHEGSEGGIYYSQALFEKDGAISAWTTWHKAAGMGAKDLKKAFYEPARGEFIIMNGADESHIDTLKRIKWAKKEQENGEINGVFEFCDNKNMPKTGILLLTGYQTLTMLDMANYHANIFVDENNRLMVQNSCKETIPSHIQRLTFSGDVLSRLGTISAAAVGNRYDDSLLFFAGTGGLAVFHNEEGNGWHGLDSLNQCVFGMQFCQIGDYQLVRKLLADEQYLYVLTDSAFDRIDLNASNFKTGNLVITRLYTAQKSVLIDALVSEKLALIGCSQGLMRVGNGADIRTAAHEDEVGWAFIELDRVKMPVLSLFPISISGRACDVARGQVGQLYALTGYIGKNCSDVYRLVIHNVVGKEINDQTVQLIDDLKIPGQKGSYIHFGEFRELFASDGTLYINTRSKNSLYPAVVLNGVNSTRFSLTADDTITHISAIRRSAVIGSWIIAGNFGLLIHE